MKIHIMIIFSIIVLANSSFGQLQNLLKEGTVSYITGQNIYVKFESTAGIENGDTLYLQKDSEFVAALVVEHHSSISCLCKTVGELTFSISDKIFVDINISQPGKVPVINENVELDVNENAIISTQNIQKENTNKQRVVGRLSLTSYSNFSNSISDDVHRFRYTFNMDAQNIADSKVSAESYISFSHKLNQWDVVKEDINNALKIYSLAVSYDFNETSSLLAGRKINTNIANVGAIDGLQFQKEWNGFFAGAVVGSRPDYSNYSFNPELLEYGAYFGQSKNVENGFVQTTLAFFEQRNNFNIDRRFTYFQHSNSFVKNMNVFASFELDLYKLENDQPKNTIDLTSLYFSIRYRFSKRLSAFGSYDSRKNVFYYETFKSYADQVIQLASRQGLRFRVNCRAAKYLLLGVSAGTRFSKNDERANNTLNGNITYTRIPGINAALTLNSNFMRTNYLSGQIFGGRLSKELVPGKISTQLNYRWVNFKYSSSNSQLQQHIAEIDFSYQFNKKLYLSVNVETTVQKEELYNRLYLNLRRKF